MNNLRKSLFFVFALLAFGQMAWAQEWPKTYECGNTTCNLTEAGVLTVTPKSNTDGAMVNYSDPSYRPWADERTRVTTINVNPGVTVIGEYCFHNFTNLTSVTLPVGLREIHKWGFSSCENLPSISIPHTVTQIESLAFGYCNVLLHVYCYPNPDNLTWTIIGDDFTYGTNPSTTQIHVYDTYLSAYQSKFNIPSDVAFVGLQPSGNWTDAGNFSASFHENGTTIYIDSEADLARVAHCVNTHVTEYLNYTFSLTRDLDMAAHYWTAIGTEAYPFRGSFEGNGHTIRGITFRSDNNSDYVGLFGYVRGNERHSVSNGGTYNGCDYIKNLIVTHATVKGNSFVGGVAGSFKGESVFENVICQANVTGNYKVGGLIGEAIGVIDYQDGSMYESIATVKNCLLIGGVITGEEYRAAIIGNIGELTHIEKNFYINPESAAGNSYDVRAYPVTKSDIPENVTVTINTDPGLIYQGTYYAPAGTVYFSAQSNTLNYHITSVKMNGTALEATSGNNYSFEIVPATATYDITVTVEDQSVIFTTDGFWNVESNWSTNALPSSNDNVTLRANATIPSNYCANVGQITIEDGGSLTIKDGGQLIHYSNETNLWGTVEKNISHYTNASGLGNTNGWYFIATPTNDGNTPDETMLSNNYDLYRFDHLSLKWENFKNTAEHPDFTLLQHNRGYLYANDTDVTLKFTGPLTSYKKFVAEGYNRIFVYPGHWILVGNSFPCNVYVDRPFYKMNAARRGIVAVEDYWNTDNYIAPCTGFFVNTEEGVNMIWLTKDAPAHNDKGSLNVALSQPEPGSAERSGVSTGSATLVDNAIVSFNEGSVLPKFRFGDNAEIYIPQDGEDYAITYSEGQCEIPLNFKATKDGTYTLTVNPENVEMAYLHLIDNLTGADVDLLAVEPVETPTQGNGPSTSSGTLVSYTFTAKTTDYPSRFRLMFSTNGEDGPSTNSGTFAFVSNGEIIITANVDEAILQITDVTGRVIVSGDAMNRVSTGGMVPGVYVLRLINRENIKTQKIIIK